MSDEEFSDHLNRVFAALAEAQEPLGEEFERAIFENLDELYES